MNRLIPQACSLFVLAWTVCFIPALAGEASPGGDCRLRQLASIDLTVGSLVLIPVVLDGTAGFMSVNTSIAVSTIYLEDANNRKLVIHKAPQPFSNSPGIVSIESFSLGSYNVGKIQLLVFPGRSQAAPGLPPIIGSLALPQQLKADMELDFAHNKLNLFATDHCPGNVVYWADKAAAIPYTQDKLGLPIFPIELDGKKISAALRLSATGTQIKTDVSKALYGFDEHSSGIHHETSESGGTNPVRVTASARNSTLSARVHSALQIGQ